MTARGGHTSAAGHHAKQDHSTTLGLMQLDTTALISLCFIIMESPSPALKRLRRHCAATTQSRTHGKTGLGANLGELSSI